MDIVEYLMEQYADGTPFSLNAKHFPERLSLKVLDLNDDGAKYDVAKALTDRFEKQHKGYDWSNGDFFDRLEDFLCKEIVRMKDADH